MKTLGIVILVILGIYFAPAILAAAIGVIVSFGVLVFLGGLAGFVTFLVAGSLLMAFTVAAVVVLMLTVGSWLPLLLVVLFGVWLFKRTQTV